MKPISILLLIFTCALALPDAMAAPPGAKMPLSVPAVVQQFYDWYVPASEKDKDMSGVEMALKQKPGIFSPELLQALQDDVAASAKDPDEVVGLDFDPFLNSQDPCGKYQAGKVTREGDTYHVEVFGDCSDEDHRQPDVIAELRLDKRRWIFVNFIYPGQGDLLTELQALSKDRQKK